jgi:hypothetical protein
MSSFEDIFQKFSEDFFRTRCSIRLVELSEWRDSQGYELLTPLWQDFFSAHLKDSFELTWLVRPAPSLHSSPLRQKEWITGRILLKKAIEDLLPFADLSSHFSKTSSSNQFKASLAHSTRRTARSSSEANRLDKDHLVAAIALAQPMPPIWKGIGIDLEPRDRQVDSRLAQKILKDPEESKLSISALEAWCIKEACWKALGTFSPKTISQIQILSFDKKGGEARFPGQPSDHSLYFQLVDESGWLFSLAGLKNSQ